MFTARWSAAALACVLAALTTMGAPPASAAESSDEPPRVELLLDVSGSMRAADIDGRTRMEVAKQAFNEVLDAIPEETHVGIRVFGAQHRFPGASKAVGCKDTSLLSPVGPVDRTAVKTAIATLRPTGWTPIGLALRAAAKDLGTGETNRY